MSMIYCGKIEEPILGSVKHDHPVWEIILRLMGDATFYVGKKTYYTSPGDIILVPPNTTHGSNSDMPYTDIYIMIDNLDFTDTFVVKDYDNSVLLLMNLLHKTFTENENNCQPILDSLGETIYQYIKKNLTINYKYTFVKDLKNIIYDNIANCDFNISNAIRNMGYHVDYVRKCFIEEMGTTPSKYLTTLRINQAKGMLLQESFISVEETAFKCGFRDNFYFSRVFKKQTGISPLKYKQRNIQ